MILEHRVHRILRGRKQSESLPELTLFTSRQITGQDSAT